MSETRDNVHRLLVRGEPADQTAVVQHLRLLADSIEAGTVGATELSFRIQTADTTDGSGQVMQRHRTYHDSMTVSYVGILSGEVKA